MSKSCIFFKQLPLRIKQKFEYLFHVGVGVLSFSADKPLDFHDTTFSVSPNLFKLL